MRQECLACFRFVGAPLILVCFIQQLIVRFDFQVLYMFYFGVIDKIIHIFVQSTLKLFRHSHGFFFTVARDPDFRLMKLNRRILK